MRPVSRLLAVGLLALMAGGQDVGSAARAVAPVGETEDARRFAFSFRLPPVRSEPGSDGFHSIDVVGFDRTVRRVGAPDLPTTTVRVAIPEGSTPRLVIRNLAETRRPGVRPRPVPSLAATSRGGDTALSALGPRLPGDAPAVDVVQREIVRADASIYSGVGPWPSQVARLGPIGRFRDQRYVEVRLSPLRFDPAIAGLRVAESFEVEVLFEDAPAATGAATVTDEGLEAVYRRAFVNYEQGRGFRLEPEAVATSASAGVGVDDVSARRRIRVRAHGMVRLDYNRISGTGFLAEPLSTWKLTNRGQEVPLLVMDDDGDAIPEATDGNDLLDPGEWVQFWGQALDEGPKAALHTAQAGEDIYEYIDYTDENVYFLTVDGGGPRSRVSERVSGPTLTRTPPVDFEDVARAEVDDLQGWRPLRDADPFYWLPTLFGPDQRVDDVPLPGFNAGNQSVQVRVRMQGRSEDASVFPDHATRVTLQNTSNQNLQVDNDDGTFDGRMIYDHDFPWSGTGLGSTARVKLEVLSPPNGAVRNDAILDFIEIRYRRLFEAAGDTLTFSWPDGDAEFEIANVQSADAEVWELTGRVAASDVVDPVRLTNVQVTGVGPYTVRFRMDTDSSGLDRRFVVAGAGAVTIPANPDFQTDTVSDLRSTTNDFQMIVITHPDLLDDPQNCADTVLTQWINLRVGQGIGVKVVCVEDVYDEFNDGIEGADAIRDFIAYAMTSWQSPPRYVLLAGDASYAYKEGTAQGNFVPTQVMFRDAPQLGHYASDTDLAAVLGTDPTPDLMIGRIPARTPAELDLVLGKILDYEQAPPVGDWRKHALFVADRGKRSGGSTGPINVGESLQFEDTNQAAEDFMQIPPYTSRQLRYFSDFCNPADPSAPCDVTGMRQQVKAGVNGTDAFSGAAMVQFNGHGSYEVWSDDAFFDERDPAILRDTNDLDNDQRLPWMMAHNCLTGGFHTLLDHSMGEDWLLRDDGTGGGGAVAVYSPTGLSFGFLGRRVSDIVWDDLFGPPKARTVEVPVLDSLIDLCSVNVEACQNYAFQGDPALNLVLPAVAPATNLLACTEIASGQVDLSWTGNGQPGITYDVYRATFPADDPRYDGTLAGSTGTTTFQDTGLVNAKTYYYHVVARDVDGFESAWSNFNTGCATSGDDCIGDGDDCVKAVPLNPNAPANPGNLQWSDPEVGGRIDLTWTANSESDLDFYEVHYSTTPNCFAEPTCTPDVDNAGRKNSYSLTGLQNDTTYYIVVTATNTSGKRSGPSNQVEAIATLVRGIGSPDLITDLQVDRSGNDAVLTWSAVTSDINGKTETVDRYQVYRGTTPGFVPVPGDLVWEGTALSWTDVGAMTPGGQDYFYLVRAVDVDGFGGGLGRQLPGWIEGLVVDWGVGKASVILSWPAVSSDVDGVATLIDHYEVYASDQLYGRDQICDPLATGCTGLTPLTTVTGTSVQLTPPSANQYYSVLAVDTRGNRSPF